EGRRTISPANNGLPRYLPNVLQSVGNVNGAGTSTTATLTPTQQGNTFVVECAVNNTGTLAVSDNNANTYTTAKSQTGTSAGALISYAVGINTGATTFTCTCGTSGVCMIQAYEVSGLLAQIPSQPDTTDANTFSSVTAAPLNAGLAPFSPNELAFAAVVHTAATATSVTAASNWTQDTNQSATGGRLIPMRKALGALTKETGNMVTWTTSETGAFAAATFRPVVL